MSNLQQLNAMSARYKDFPVSRTCSFTVSKARQNSPPLRKTHTVKNAKDQVPV
jgi:hypothetical protein